MTNDPHGVYGKRKQLQAELLIRDTALAAAIAANDVAGACDIRLCQQDAVRRMAALPCSSST
jgi:hypothetical protein